MRVCECGLKAVAKGKCKSCYNRAWREANPKTPDVPDETKHFIIDVSDHSVVIVCKSCGWRCVELMVTDALYRLHRHSARYDHLTQHGLDNYHQYVVKRFKAYRVAVPEHLEEAYADAIFQRRCGPRKPYKPRKGPKAAA